ncbi:MAG: 2-oxoglutarate dehydrogenase E1 component, partial [Gammaproteobacteria bacterium]|nr:2-oxoglutarate dehydrogenase E1 component [Gammaproteobacteria bacterium]
MSMKKLQQESYLSGSNAVFIEELYAKFLQNENDVDENWRNWFSELKDGELTTDQDHLAIQEQMKSAVMNKKISNLTVSSGQHEHQVKQVAVLQLINAYRIKGHQKADLDPLKLQQVETIPDLTLAGHNLSEADLDTVFNTGSMFGVDEVPLRNIVERLEKTYCGTLASEYMYIEDLAQKRWVQERLETSLSTPDFREGRKNRILDRIIAAENLEKYLHTRYIGQKRFSLEGGESLIPLLDRIIQEAGATDTHEVVIGMA